MLKRLLYSYDVTITFTLLAVLNLTSWWGNFPYRMVMVLMNIVIGASVEHLVNQLTSLQKRPLFKGIVALVLLVTNIIWIVITMI
ncbi:hypothetical protein DBP97_10805 [Lactobacillus helveticus]|uniref:Uncharacterized protein n=1 Tax=Lactobacillus helveticus TaxID=1587 RepID=A0A3Q8SUZ1_LACHE|nr:hypothetical protein [Lactobacillus helveticus]ADX71045.1 Hypothetical cytosolic protein [Lactobacillus helveticus H10]AFR22866.1 hypothetical protein R0052_10845 [Lactobacillus helveticus R0052]AZK91554.1 hypothetical protein LH5_01312 [Lactobacillus helveticus]MCJ2191210.1 hypothetical protein [Lactobacillus helveticus]MED7629095.1 hypothetical protein [Lactobacillus helveticus]